MKLGAFESSLSLLSDSGISGRSVLPVTMLDADEYYQLNQYPCSEQCAPGGLDPEMLGIFFGLPHHGILA